MKPATNAPVLTVLLGVVWALGFPALPISGWIDEFASTAHLLLYEALWWAAVLLLLAYVRFAEKNTLASLGFVRPRTTDLLAGFAGGLVTLAGLAAIFLLLLPLLHASESAPLAKLQNTPVWWRLASTARAAFGEEILFRGYALTRLDLILRSRTTAALLTWAIFTIEHVSIWGWGHLLIAGFAGALLTALFLWRKNLWSPITAHFLIDAVSVLT